MTFPSRLVRLGSISAGAFALALASMGCSGAEATVGEGAEEAISSPASLELALTISESKEVFSSKVESFAVRDGKSLNLPCRDRAFNMTSKPSLYGGWSPASADKFSEDAADTTFREYIFASCRNADTEVLGWFGKPRDIEFIVSEQLLDKDYDPGKLPLLLRLRGLDSGKPAYYACSSAFKKTLVKESATAKLFEIGMTCKSRKAPTSGELGPIDFVDNPGPYAAVASYREWMMPSIAANKANFERVRDALLAKVKEGKYAGAMSTLGKTCTLSVDEKGDTLVVDHTIDSSDRTRHLELKADDLLGFAEGDVFADPIRVKGAPTGKLAAAEFRDGKGGSFVIRFEANTSNDGQIVRINGPETYCRRLAKK